MKSPGWMPARAAGVSSIGDTTLTRPFSIGDFDAEAAEFAAGLHLHLVEALGVHIARVRVERAASMPLIAFSTSCWSVTSST